MLRSRLGIMVAAAATLGMAMERPPTVKVEHRDEIDGEKMSRQRKRWLERRARKQMRKHKTTRR